MTSRSLLRRRLLPLAASAAVIAGAGATIALAAGDDPAAPPAKSLGRAVADAIATPAPAGVSARVVLTNDLPPALAGRASQLPSVLRGAQGRVWMADDRLRADLRARDGERVQAVVDDRRFWVYDSAADRVVRGTLPAGPGRGAGGAAAGPEAIGRLVALVQERATISAPEPGVVAGRPAYSVEVKLKGAAGLGRGELTWDAAHAIPLRAAVYLGGGSSPAFEVRAEQVRLGVVAADTFAVEPPASADVVEVPRGR